MIDVDLLSVIRRWHGRDKLPIREITRRTGLSRNTIKKYLANGEITPAYPARQSVSKLDPFADTLLSWLKREARRNRKQRRNLKQLHRQDSSQDIRSDLISSFPSIPTFAFNWLIAASDRCRRWAISATVAAPSSIASAAMA